MEDRITLPCVNSISGFENITVYADGGNIVIQSKKSEEVIPISQIQSFTLKKPGINGVLTIVTARSATAGVNLGFGVSAATGAQTVLLFKKARLEQAEQLRDYVMDCQSQQVAFSAAPPTAGSVANEIRGLKSLLDDGILTQEEFDAKKAQLLGL